MAGKSVDLLKLLRNRGKGDLIGVKIVTAVTTEPDKLTFIFEGTKLALPIDRFSKYLLTGTLLKKKTDRFNGRTRL